MQLGTVDEIATLAVRMVDGAESASPRAGRPVFDFRVTFHREDPSDRLTTARVGDKDDALPLEPGNLPLLFACIGHELERRRMEHPRWR